MMIVPLWPIGAGSLAGLAANGGQNAAERALRELASWTGIRAADRAQPRTREVMIEEIGQRYGDDTIRDKRLIEIEARPEAYLVAAAPRSELGAPGDRERLGPAGMLPRANAR